MFTLPPERLSKTICEDLDLGLWDAPVQQDWITERVIPLKQERAALVDMEVDG
jgi:hypothetical protein